MIKINNASEAAQAALNYEKQWLALEQLKHTLEDYVLSNAKTLQVGNVRISFRNGTKTYNTKEAALSAPQGIINKHTTIIPASEKVNYLAICKEAKIKREVSSVGVASVNITVEVIK